MQLRRIDARLLDAARLAGGLRAALRIQLPLVLPGALAAACFAFTLAINDQLLGNPSMRTRYSDFVLVAGMESPLVVYMRKDTPPGVVVETQIGGCGC